MEEMFFILKGEGALRNAADKRAVRTGAFHLRAGLQR
jgi:uncharacterized cupin superfamily protein